MKTIIAILTILAFAFAGYFYIDSRYALSQEFKDYKKTTDYQFMSIRVEKLQDRIWQIQDRYRSKKMDDAAEKELRELQRDKEEVGGKMKALEK